MTDMKDIIHYLLLLLLCISCTATEYSNNAIADAIKKAENSSTHPYGILVKYKHVSARQACLNTIAHARKDWDGKGDFIAFLGKRYAPVGAANDPKGLNKNWVRNVNFWLKKANK